MLSKKNTDKINSNMSVFFSDLSHYSYSHQLYEAFVMLIKRESSSDEEYLDDEMRVGKTMTAIML